MPLAKNSPGKRLQYSRTLQRRAERMNRLLDFRLDHPEKKIDAVTGKGFGITGKQLRSDVRNLADAVLDEKIKKILRDTVISDYAFPAKPRFQQRKESAFLLAQEGRFSRSEIAEKLGVARETIIRDLRKMEKKYGKKLPFRLTARVRDTPLVRKRAHRTNEIFDLTLLGYPQLQIAKKQRRLKQHVFADMAFLKGSVGKETARLLETFPKDRAESEKMNRIFDLLMQGNNSQRIWQLTGYRLGPLKRRIALLKESVEKESRRKIEKALATRSSRPKYVISPKAGSPEDLFGKALSRGKTIGLQSLEKEIAALKSKMAGLKPGTAERNRLEIEVRALESARKERS